MQDTSWQKISSWYDKAVGERGSYYHQRVILPNTIRLLNLDKKSKILDLACGQGVLARVIGGDAEYLGLDLAPGLIEEARKLDNNPLHRYGVADVSKELPITRSGFSHATLILALQNIKHPYKVITNTAKHLVEGGKLVIVLNHPAFRIPKHSDWQTDKVKRIQYRKMDNYMTPVEIPIDSSPFDKKDNQVTMSFHNPISTYTEMLYDNGFLIEKMEEWISPKKSEGGMAEVEDRARKEFPLFLAIMARKVTDDLHRRVKDK